METKTAKKQWTIPEWMKPFEALICNTGGNDVAEMYNGDADPYINLPLSTLQAVRKIPSVTALHTA